MPSLHPPRDIDAILSEGFKVETGARFNEGLELFKSKLNEFVKIGAIFLGIIIVVNIAGMIVTKILSYAHLSLIGSILSSLASMAVIAVAQSAIFRYIFGKLRGENVGFNDFLVIDDLTQKIVIGSLIQGALITIGSFLCVLPGLFFAFATLFALPLIVDRGMEPIPAIKASINVFMKNPVEVLILGLVCWVVTVIGAICCGVGLIVSIPLAACIIGCAYAHVFGLSGVEAAAE